MDVAIERRDDAGTGQYALFLDGQHVGELDYRTRDGVRTFTHTGVRPEHEGQGLGGRLAERGLADARAEGVTVVPRCWFIGRYLDQHPELADLLAS